MNFKNVKYLGIDFGLRRIGLATSEGNLAAPFTTLRVRGFKDATRQVLELIKKERFNKVIVGLPEGKMGQTVSGFIKALTKEGVEVESADETLSSQQATLKMIELNIPQTKRRINDAYSAAIILQNYIESLHKR